MRNKCTVQTSTHDVVPEDRDPEPERQHEEVRGEAREELRETRRLGAEVPKASSHEDPWRQDQDQVKPALNQD